MSTKVKESKYLWYLPSIYQVKGDAPTFLGLFLKAFEKILSGIDDGVNVYINGQTVEGIEEILDNIHDKFDPEVTDEDFLQWLAGWVALSLRKRESWNDSRKRELIAKIVPLYQKRGTKEGLEEYLKIYLGEEAQKVRIIDELSPFQIGVSSRVGVDARIDGLPLYYFIVEISISTTDLQKQREIVDSIKEIIDFEKPAHTCYQINY
jgi:phage tail-like protein